MFKFDKKDMDERIRKTKHPNWNKISFDYVLPGEEYVYSLTKSGKPRWFFELKEQGGISTWINRVNFLEKYQKDKDKEARSQEKVQQLKKLVGLVETQGQQQPTQSLFQPIASGRSSTLSSQSGRSSGLSSISAFNQYLGSSTPPQLGRASSTPPQLTQPVEDFDKQTQPQGPIARIPRTEEKPKTIDMQMMTEVIQSYDPENLNEIKQILYDRGYDPEVEFNLFSVIMERQNTNNLDDAIDNILNRGVNLIGLPEKEPDVKFSDVNWKDKKIRDTIGFLLRDYKYRQTENNKNKIIEYLKLNPKLIPKNFTTSNIKTNLPKLSIESLQLEK